jgi:DNA-binding beta-propeller fold protein YncE
MIGWWAGPRSIGVGTEGADALAMSPDGRTLYAANWDEEGNSGGITVVNLASGQVGTRIGIGGPAVQLVMMPGGRALYALVELDDDGDRLVRVVLPTLRADEQIVFSHGAEDTVAAPAGSLLYVLAGTSRNSMAVIPVDADSGQERKAIPVPADSQSIAVSPDGRTLYIGTGNADGKGPGEVIAVDSSSGDAAKPVRFPHAVFGLAVSPDGRRLFGLASSYQCTDGGTCGGRCDLAGVDTMTGTALRPVRLDSGCAQIEVAPDRDRLFVLSGDESLAVVNIVTGQVEKTMRTAGLIAGDGASDLLLAPDGRTAYVADQFKGVVVLPVGLLQVSSVSLRAVRRPGSGTTSSPAPHATGRTRHGVSVGRSGRRAPHLEHDDAFSRRDVTTMEHDLDFREIYWRFCDV